MKKTKEKLPLCTFIKILSLQIGPILNSKCGFFHRGDSLWLTKQPTRQSLVFFFPSTQTEPLLGRRLGTPPLLSDLLTIFICLGEQDSFVSEKKWYLQLMCYWPPRAHRSSGDRTGSGGADAPAEHGATDPFDFFTLKGWTVWFYLIGSLEPHVKKAGEKAKRLCTFFFALSLICFYVWTFFIYLHLQCSSSIHSIFNTSFFLHSGPWVQYRPDNSI